MNKSTGKQKGTAFLEFEDAEGAQAACSAAEAQAEGGAALTLRGKPLTVHAALVQDKARSLAAQLGGKGESKPGRNLHLVRAVLATHACYVCCICVHACAGERWQTLCGPWVTLACISSCNSKSCCVG